MASQNLNVGTTANDTTGHGLRTAFINVRKMFAEIYGITYSSDTQDISGTTFGVPLGSIADQAANTVIVRDANSAGDLSAKALATTEILIGDGTGFTAAALSGAVTMSNAGAVTIGNDQIDSQHYVDGSIDTDFLADDQVTHGKLGVEFTASNALTSATAITVDTNLADVFTLTTAHSHTFNFTNVQIGDIKTIEITGSGGSLTSAFGTSNGSSCTYNKIGGAYDDDAAKELIQIKWTATNVAWYQISPIAA